MTHTSDVPTLPLPASPPLAGTEKILTRPLERHQLWGSLIRERMAQGLRVKDMAQRLGVVSTAVSKMENGPVPSVESMARYAEALGLEVVVGLRRRAVSGTEE